MTIIQIKFVKVSGRECPWCKAVCAFTDKYCHECGWYIAKPQLVKESTEVVKDLVKGEPRTVPLYPMTKGATNEHDK